MIDHYIYRYIDEYKHDAMISSYKLLEMKLEIERKKTNLLESINDEQKCERECP